MEERPKNTGDYDVAVVGFGPVGQVLAILLGQQGHRVAVVERYEGIYPKPRAVVFDDEIARVLASAGIADRFVDVRDVASDYEWRNVAGETLLRFDFSDRGDSGWPESNMVTQPRLEDVLCQRVAALPNVTVFRSTEAVQLQPDDAGVDVTVCDSLLKRKILRAAYVVGCDGANSFVRQRMNTAVTDLGFFHDWLICDVLPREQRCWSPTNLQLCDPARPTTMVSGGPGRRRWEFMRMPGDIAEEFDSDETAWRLLAASGITPENATLEKRAVYTFHARWVDDWRDGRLLIAGDAAHLMPPFRGQGMCSGIRDAANLAWKLDLALRDVAAPDLLDTYVTERSAHVQHAIQMSVELGKVICETDPEKVAQRDAHLIGAGARPETALPPVPPAALGPGALQSDDAGKPLAPAGQVAVQGRVRSANGADGLFDDVAGVGFRLLVDGERLPNSGLSLELSAEHARLLSDIDARIVPAVRAGADVRGDAVEDLDGVLLPFLRSAGHAVQAIRPDGYVFGGVSDVAELPRLLTQLAAALRLAPAPSVVAKRTR
ncbi:flavoprotein hydroxylase [Prauserella aidingensis]|uniref:bifunctional 3-(3-hydroxy-phenyl)propionate/3-hydroxycinnamic acid hydroxylase MhpA n=1 Tax=Prauserella aidingensis TaxID=387890 RepID=UPI0020A32BAF|nr:bifunctional 3-(3-hydroxy-phenyl)propionate/3-hydroxycinnamic acid hydroxylase [Prauserella aidingensis]MCP2256005.1 flavoprotein hydroxylase [Prauserella aidingensis]